MARGIDTPPRQIGDWNHDLTLRSEVVRRATSAQMVLTALHADVRWIPPPVVGGPVMTGLLNTIFIHETIHGGVGYGPQSWRMVLDIVDASLESLQKMTSRSAGGGRTRSTGATASSAHCSASRRICSV
jgi:hypothetical protein